MIGKLSLSFFVSRSSDLSTWTLTSASALIVALGLSIGCSGSSAPARMEVGAELPEFTLPALDGSKVSSGSFGATGEATVINFWATWCQPCRKEMPELAAVSQHPNLKVIGIALDEEGAASVGPFVESHGIDYPILLGDQEIFQRLGGFAIPYTLVLNSDRRVVNVYRGPATEAELRRDLEGLIGPDVTVTNRDQPSPQPAAEAS